MACQQVVTWGGEVVRYVCDVPDHIHFSNGVLSRSTGEFARSTNVDTPAKMLDRAIRLKEAGMLMKRPTGELHSGGDAANEVPAPEEYLEQEMSEKHPTLSQIRDRDELREMKRKQALSAHRLCLYLPLGLMPLGLLLFRAGPVGVAVGTSALLVSAFLLFCFFADGPSGLEDIPPSLKINKFSPQANRNLMAREQVRKFSAVSDCPGCEKTDIHGFVNPLPALPVTSCRDDLVARQCLVCDRMWLEG